MTASEIELRVNGWVVSVTRSMPAALAALIAWMISTFLACPGFSRWNWEWLSTKTRAGDFLRLCDSPLARNLDEPLLAYRITVPLIAFVAHLPQLAALMLPYLAHLGFLAVCFTALRQRVDQAVASVGTLIVALSFSLFWANWNPGVTDTTTHLLAISLLLCTSLWWASMAIVLGMFSDERMILALPFVLCWHLYAGRSDRSFQKIRGLVVGILLGLGVYGFLRYALTVGWIGPGIARPEVYVGIEKRLGSFQPHLGSWGVWAQNVFLAYRWAWIFLFVHISVLVMQRAWWAAAVFGAALFLGTMASSVVADVARSVGFMVPAWLLAIAALGQADPVRLLTWSVRIACAMIVTPVVFTWENYVLIWSRPLLLEVLRYFPAVDPVQWLK